MPFGALPASCSGRRRAVTASRDRMGEAARATRAARHCPGRTPASSHTVLIQFPANQARGSEPALRAAENRGSTTGWLWRPKQVAQTRGLWPRRPPSPVPSASQSRAKTLLPVGPAGATGARRGLVQDQGQLPPTPVPLGEAPPPVPEGLIPREPPRPSKRLGPWANKHLVSRGPGQAPGVAHPPRGPAQRPAHRKQTPGPLPHRPTPPSEGQALCFRKHFTASLLNLGSKEKLAFPAPHKAVQAFLQA